MALGETFGLPGEGAMTMPMDADGPNDGGRHGMDGRIARQWGAPRGAWRSIPTGLNLASIRSWQSGWDDEDARIRAGGLPMTESERLSLGRDLSFVSSMERAMAFGVEGVHPVDGGDVRIDADGQVHMAGETVGRLMALAGCGDPEGHGTSMGDWVLEPDMAKEWTEAARRRIEGLLRPHLGTAATGDR